MGHSVIEKKSMEKNIFFRKIKEKLTSSSASFSMAVNDSASARLSTAMAKNTFSRISFVFVWSRNGLTIFFSSLTVCFYCRPRSFSRELEERKGYNYRI